MEYEETNQTVSKLTRELENALKRLDTSFSNTSLRGPDGVPTGTTTTSMDDRWLLLPAFLKTRGLVKQHIDSFDYFVTEGIEEIVRADSNRRLTSDIDPDWYLEYKNVKISKPNYRSVMQTIQTTPMMCRTRDMTYASDILVDIEYIRGDQVVRRSGHRIGRLPIMLRSRLCVLKERENEIEKLGECPHDPGGYFIIRGTEKVLLMQEQISNNRIIVELDSKKLIQAYVTSSTADNKSRTVVCSKPTNRDGPLFVKHSAFTDLIPVVVMLRAFGLSADQEIMQTVGGLNNKSHLDGLTCSIHDAHSLGIFTQLHALEYLGTKLKIRIGGTIGNSNDNNNSSEAHLPSVMRIQRIGESLEVLVRQVLSHISVYSDGTFSSAFSTNNNAVDDEKNIKNIDLSAKARFLCLMVRRTLDGRSDSGLLDDRDYYGNKRLELAGQLISLLFEDLFKSMNTELRKLMDTRLSKYQQQGNSTSGNRNRVYPDAIQDIDEKRITNGIIKAISSGNWNIKRFRVDRTGVSQILNRLSFIATLGVMCRVKSQFEKSRKLAGPRALQPSQWGMLCPSDTPEGEQCGLIKALSLMTHVTTPEDSIPIRYLCFTLGTEPMSQISGEELDSGMVVMVILNGAILGGHRIPNDFMRKMRILRRRGKIGEFISIYEDESQRAIIISTDGGRLCRPLVVVEKGIIKLNIDDLSKLKANKIKWSYFLENGVVEWLDVNEENNCLIASNIDEVENANKIGTRITHMEVHSLTLLGAVAGLIPFPHNNQSPRNTYQCAMGKQAMGNIACNQHMRTDTTLLLMTYPQKPMCKTKTIDLIGAENLPAGHNASVAVCSFSGYDIEDAIVMNRDSIDRGFGRCCSLRKHASTLQRSAGASMLSVVEEVRPIEIPIDGTLRIDKRIQALDPYDGVALVGKFVSDGNILINKFSPLADASSSSDYRHTPVCYKNPTNSYIDKVIVTEDEDAAKVIKVMTRLTRIPEIGDKFSSRHGQKGVVGLIVGQEDMPFSETGWVPDLIMNPHGFPSRMTVGKLLECLSGKAGVLDGHQSYGSIFSGTDREYVEEALIRHGYSPTGKEYINSGITGEALECFIYAGPIFYQKLKHMVMDKIHARSTGPVNQMTRQPTEGRAKDGGLRLGEMERDCLVAYGASNLILERLLLSSDAVTSTVCTKCGLLSYNGVDGGYCNLCRSDYHLVQIRIPYACKLLFQELQAMNVVARLRIGDK